MKTDKPKDDEFSSEDFDYEMDDDDGFDDDF